MTAAGRVVLRAAASHIFTEMGRSPVVPSEFVVPALPPTETRVWFPGVGYFGYGDAMEWRFTEGSFDRPAERNVGHAPHHAARLDARQIEHVLDEPAEAVALGVDDREEAAQLLGHRHPLQLVVQDLGERLDRGGHLLHARRCRVRSPS